MSSDSDPEMFPYNPVDDWGPFNFQDPFLTPPVSRAVLNGDVNQIRSLIERGKSVNSPDNNGNVPLHLAVINNRTEILDLLLSCSDINLDNKNFLGYTPLLAGLHEMTTNSSIIMRLLEANCSIDARTNMEETALHLAVSNFYPEIILCELIKGGADVNARDDDNLTPLHRAARCNNIAAVHVLLYFDADVSLVCTENMNAFMYAAKNSSEIAKILFNFYDDFSCISKAGYNSLLLAAKNRNAIAVDLVKAGVDVNYFIPRACHLAFYSLVYPNAELFKEVWSRIDYETVLHDQDPFLYTFVVYCRFPSSEFLECLFLILNSSCITDLVNPPIHRELSRMRADYLFSKLISNFHRRKIPRASRLDIIRILLSYGYRVHMQDIAVTYNLYGINEELEILIQAGCCYRRSQKDCYCNVNSYPLLIFILAIEEGCNSEQIFHMFKKQVETYYLAKDEVVAKHNILHALGFFAIPLEDKQKLINLDSEIQNEISEKLSAVPEVPSLIEICRSQTRRFIRQTYGIEQPYQFYDVVKRLNVPESVKDIIRFRKPLYV